MQKDICVPLTASCILFGQTHTQARFRKGHHPAVPPVNSDLWGGRHGTQQEKGARPKNLSFVFQTLPVRLGD